MSKYKVSENFAGCVETLTALNRAIYVDLQGKKLVRLGWYEGTKTYPEKEDVAKPGDYTFGCCFDVIIRDNLIYLAYEDGNNWPNFNLGDKFKYKHAIQVKWDSDWAEKLTAGLAELGADDFFTKLESGGL